MAYGFLVSTLLLIKFHMLIHNSYDIVWDRGDWLGGYHRLLLSIYSRFREELLTVHFVSYQWWMVQRAV